MSVRYNRDTRNHFPLDDHNLNAAANSLAREFGKLPSADLSQRRHDLDVKTKLSVTALLALAVALAGIGISTGVQL